MTIKVYTSSNIPSLFSSIEKESWYNYLPYYADYDTKACILKFYLAGFNKNDIVAEIINKTLIISYNEKVLISLKLPENFKRIKSASMKDGLLVIEYTSEEESKKIRID